MGRASQQLQLPLDFGVDFDVENFDRVIADKGVPFIHLRAVPCPVGRTGQYDYRSAEHASHSNCSNGFVYREAGEVRLIYSGNTANLIQIDLGILTGSSVVVTAARFYSGGQEQCLLHPFDRLYFPSDQIVVAAMELFEVSGLPSDRVKFPIVAVSDLVGSDGTEYTGAEYEVRDGRIWWKTQKRPKYDPVLKHGDTCSIRYTMRPWYHVKQLLHDVRCASIEAFDGTPGVSRLPQSALLQRENVFEDESRDAAPRGEESAREVFAPARFNLGPR